MRHFFAIMGIIPTLALSAAVAPTAPAIASTSDTAVTKQVSTLEQAPNIALTSAGISSRK